MFTSSVALGAILSQALPQPLVPHASTQIDIEYEDVALDLRRIDFWDGYVVFVGTATATDGSACIARSDFALQLGDIQYEPTSREKTRQGYGIDAPGTGFFIQCLSGNIPEIVLLPFVVPVNQAEASILYKNQLFKLPSSLEMLKQSSEEAQPPATFTPTPTRTPTPTPTVTFTPAPLEVLDSPSSNFSLPLPSSASSVFSSGAVSNQGIKFTLERIDFWNTLPDSTRPSKDIFIVFTGTLIPVVDKSSSHCVGAEDVELLIGRQVYQMDDMRSANQFYQSEFPGYILPQCVSSSTPVTTFFVYDIALTDDKVLLSFHDALLQLDLSMTDLASKVSISPPTTPTSTANSTSPAFNSAETSTKEPVETPTETPVAAIISRGTVNRNANLRAGPGTNFDIVGSAKANQSIEIIGSNSTQDWLQLTDGKWIAAFLVTDISEPILTLQPTSVPTRISNFHSTGLPTLISTSVEEVEAVLGEPSMIIPFDAGDMIFVHDGAGETRGYDWSGYLIIGYYDKSGILKGLQIEDGLADKGYKISEWYKVAATFGLPNNVPPDVVALAAVRWDNLSGFKVNIIADGIHETNVIWTIQISAME